MGWFIDGRGKTVRHVKTGVFTVNRYPYNEPRWLQEALSVGASISASAEFECPEPQLMGWRALVEGIPSFPDLMRDTGLIS